MDLSPLEALSIKSACERLCLDYAHFADSGQMDAWADLFAEDAQMRLFGKTHAGRAAIRQSVSAPGPNVTVHSMSNIRISPLGADRAAGVSIVTVYSADPAAPPATLAPVIVGRYVDEYVLTPEGWRIARREFQPVITRAQG